MDRDSILNCYLCSKNVLSNKEKKIITKMKMSHSKQNV